MYGRYAHEAQPPYTHQGWDKNPIAIFNTTNGAYKLKLNFICRYMGSSYVPCFANSSHSCNTLNAANFCLCLLDFTSYIFLN